MHAYVSTPSALTTRAATLSAQRAPRFSLSSSGSVAVIAGSQDASYEVITASIDGRPVLAISLGGRKGPGSLLLYLEGEWLPPLGQYPMGSSWSRQRTGQPAFHAGFAAGSPEHPVGWFHGESGWVTITKSAPGRVSGRFEIQARGYLATDPHSQSHWVTLRGRFDAAGDGRSEAIARLQ